MSVRLSRLSTVAAMCGEFAATAPQQHGDQQQSRAVSRDQLT